MKLVEVKEVPKGRGRGYADVVRDFLASGMSIVRVDDLPEGVDPYDAADAFRSLMRRGTKRRAFASCMRDGAVYLRRTEVPDA